MGKIILKAYVEPKEHKGGHCAYIYDMDEKLHEFCWVHPDKARVYDSSELPEEMLYSFTHGINDFRVNISNGETWQLSDLE